MQEHKKWIVKNAKIWTGNLSAKWADAMVIDGDKIAEVGTWEKLGKKYTNLHVFDAEGKMVMPSFVDPHIHVTAVAKSMWYLLIDRDRCDTMEQLLGQITAYAEKHSKKEVPFIYATSCPMEWMDRATKEDLDRVISDRPVLLCDEGFHRCLVNSKMLELMEVDEHTPYDKTTSMNYERDEKGVPNGIVYEHRYERDMFKMFDKLGWYPPDQKDPDVIKPFLDMLCSWGVSTVLDGFTEGEGTFKGFAKLEKRGELKLHYYGNSLFHNLDDLEDAIERVKRWRQYESAHIHINSVKLFLDGTNEIGTSAVMEPYCNDPQGKNCGVLNMSEDDLVQAFLRINDEGLDMQIHMVGDRAFHTAINAVERAQNEAKKQDKEFTSHITLLHCELTKPKDRLRVKKLGIYINITPHWNGGIFGDGAVKFLGRERYESFYAFNDMIRDGAVVSCSSDVVDLEDMPRANPFIGMEVGHTRRDIVPDAPLRVREEECIDREALLYGYTMQAARCVGAEDVMGSLEAGKAANFLVLSDNFFEVPARKIHEIAVERRFFEGEEV